MKVSPCGRICFSVMLLVVGFSVCSATIFVLINVIVLMKNLIWPIVILVTIGGLSYELYHNDIFHIKTKLEWYNKNKTLERLRQQ